MVAVVQIMNQIMCLIAGNYYKRRMRGLRSMRRWRIGRMETHGLSNTKIYKVYLSMLNRCYKKYDKFYPDYGGKGITICKEWRGDSQAFYD